MPKTEKRKATKPVKRNRSRVSFDDWPEEARRLLDENRRSVQITQDDLDVTVAPLGTITAKALRTRVG